MALEDSQHWGLPYFSHVSSETENRSYLQRDMTNKGLSSFNAGTRQQFPRAAGCCPVHVNDRMAQGLHVLGRKNTPFPRTALPTQEGHPLHPDCPLRPQGMGKQSNLKWCPTHPHGSDPVPSGHCNNTALLTHMGLRL
jgi:hypothetical protein